MSYISKTKGIYTDVGWKTCAKRPGSYKYEVQDANLFASWKVDYVKSDSCFTVRDLSFLSIFECTVRAYYHYPVVYSNVGHSNDVIGMLEAVDPSFQPANGSRCAEEYKVFEAALNATGRAMLHSIKGQ